MKTIKWLLILALLGVSPIGLAQSEGNAFIEDRYTEVVRFEEMPYPPAAWTARIQGTVVVEVQLDNQGVVSRVRPISGTGHLMSMTLDNAKKWVFKPNASKTAVIVYDFKILDGRCNRDASLFILQGANIATILACPPRINTQSSK